jgi:DNA-binding transcriptional MerR regulator
MAQAPQPAIPDKPAFKAAEVCEIAGIQPYVLRSWESEFPDLGVSRTPGGARIYRRADVERVLHIRDLVFSEGLTLAGVRKRFDADQPSAEPDDLLPFHESVSAPAFNDETRAQILKIKQELRALLDLLDGRADPQLTLTGPGAGRRRPAPRRS